MKHTKTAKKPVITKNTKILCFDLETNGLHGEAFAIGGLVIDEGGKIHDEFQALTTLEGKVDAWVKSNVLPAIKEMSLTHRSYEEMREAFWEWYLQAEAKSDYVLVSNGYPVEYRFLLNCQDADIKERFWQHPFPFIDLSSLLLPLGRRAEIAKNNATAHIKATQTLRRHHPLDDAKVSALTAFEAFKIAELIEN